MSGHRTSMQTDIRSISTLQPRVLKPSPPTEGLRAPRPKDLYSSTTTFSVPTQQHGSLEEQLRYLLHAKDQTDRSVIENDVQQVLAELQRRRRMRKAAAPPSRASSALSAAAAPRPHVLALVQACEASTEAAAASILKSFCMNNCTPTGKDSGLSLVTVPLAEFLLKQKNAPGDIDDALKLLDSAIASRHAGAMLQVGLCLRDGVGVPIDLSAALTWVERAADSGYAPAMYELGVMYEDGVEIGGKCLPSDWGEALRLYRGAAELGHTMAQLNVGKLLWRAAEAAASRAVGVCDDNTVAELRGKSREWLEAAAASGSEEATRLLRCK
ncbi:Sel1 repeat [Trypanosoma brucei equiperdum]|uniref:Sel1 repeat n=2 Tax=Trypanosoma brucei TaxID=5691 RepID=A0A3L6L6R8_9TRYP|nr:Sel1 repeat [Trypanosoma brucei equiperdum]